jgi:hypothetical protein
LAVQDSCKIKMPLTITPGRMTRNETDNFLYKVTFWVWIARPCGLEPYFPSGGRVHPGSVPVLRPD